MCPARSVLPQDARPAPVVSLQRVGFAAWARGPTLLVATADCRVCIYRRAAPPLHAQTKGRCGCKAPSCQKPVPGGAVFNSNMMERGCQYKVVHEQSNAQCLVHCPPAFQLGREEAGGAPDWAQGFCPDPLPWNLTDWQNCPGGQ